MALSVASSSTRTIASGSTVYANQVDLAGEINLTGQLTTDDGLVAANGTGDGTGTATSNPKTLVSASGVGDGIAFDTEFDRLLVESGTTDSVASGDVLDTGTLDLAGEVNLTGELQVEEAKPIALYGSFRSANAIGEGTGDATATPQTTVAASGVGEGTGTAAVMVRALVSASGVGEGFNYVFDFNPLSVSSTDTFTVASGDTTRVGEVELSGELNVSGELQVADVSATANPQRLTSATGVGEGVGTAEALPRRLVSADGIGEATASNPTFVISIPMVRGDSTDVEYHEDDDIDLGADSDGTL